MLKINRNNYIKITDFFKNNKTANRILWIHYHLLPFFVFANYPLLLIYTFFFRNNLFLKAVLVPAGVFAFITILRMVIKEQRPYVRYGIPSVFGKDTKPDSMPSRHTASAFVIALTMLLVNLTAGIIYIVIAVLISLSRLCAGVHYVRDVIAGAVISILCGIVFLFLI